jgi:hypothetical protein
MDCDHSVYRHQNEEGVYSPLVLVLKVPESLLMDSASYHKSAVGSLAPLICSRKQSVVDLHPIVAHWEIDDQADGPSTPVSRQTDEHKISSQERHRCLSRTCEEHEAFQP